MLRVVKTLYLCRHAKSSWKNPDLADFDRPLNNRGKRDAPEAGKRLQATGAKPQLLISSPAKRAIKTAQEVAAQLGYPKRKISTDERVYGGDLLSVIHKIDDSHGCVALFGHNPGLTGLAEWLTGERIGNIPTSGICGIKFDLPSWSQVDNHTGKLVFFDYPKKHPQEG